MEPDFLSFISSRAKIIATRRGVRPAIILRYWRTRLSCILRKYLAFTISHRLDRLLSDVMVHDPGNDGLEGHMLPARIVADLFVGDDDLEILPAAA